MFVTVSSGERLRDALARRFVPPPSSLHFGSSELMMRCPHFFDIVMRKPMVTRCGVDFSEDYQGGDDTGLLV